MGAGSFRCSISYQVGSLVLKSGVAVALGIIATPLAALIPLIETGLGENKNCTALLNYVSKKVK